MLVNVKGVHMEDIKCIFCNISSSQIVIEEDGYIGRKCPKCGLIFISPRPTFTEIVNLYSNDQASTEKHISASFIKRIHARHNLRIIKKFTKSGSMLEIGAGVGYFLDEAREKGFDVYGTEFNKSKADFIRNNLEIPCEESPLNISLFNKKKFDIIYHCNVISHFYNPISEFQKINAKLKKNGIVVFETGNGGDIKKEYYKFITKFSYPEHLFLFSENNLKQLLLQTGFEFIKIYTYSTLPWLVISKILQKVIDFIKLKEKNNINKHNITRVPSSDINKFGFKQLIVNIYNYFFYIIKYKIGYVVPKKGRPQTIIIIARKKK